VSVGEVVAELFMASAFLAAGRYYRDRFWLVAAVGVAVAEVVVLGRDGLRLVIFTGPISGSLVLASALFGLLLWAQVLGLPRRPALLLGIGLTSRPLRFNNRLIEVRGGFAGAIVLAQTHPDRRAEAIAILEAQIGGERALHPPDIEWTTLRDDLAGDDAAWIDLILAGVPVERIADQAAVHERLRTRWTEMAERAAADQRLLANPARRRRATAMWLSALGTSLLIAAIAQTRTFDLPSLGVANGRVWVVAAMFVGAAVALVGSLMFALRGR
jgi:hypothetical protein